MSLDTHWRTALRRSPLGLGGAPLGNLYRALSDADAVGVIQAALAEGVGYFDTAPHYGNGRSEQRFGMALRDVTRERFLLSTKVGRLLERDADAPRDEHGYVDVLPFVQHYDYSYGGTLRALDESRERLRLARIDIALIHDIDATTHGAAQPRRFREAMEGAVPALARCKAEGAIRALGLGVNDVQVCLDTLVIVDIDVILLAGRYTLADQTALPVLLPECTRRNVAVIAGGPFNSGILATGARPRDGSTPYFDYAPASPKILARVGAIETVCAEFGVPLPAAALQFPRAHPVVVNVLVGARSRAELDANLRFARELASRRSPFRNSGMSGCVDAHHHIWSLARGDYGWLTPALAPIHRDFSLAELAPLAAAAGVTATVLVQAAPTVAETRYLLDVAKRSSGFVGGVVGWADLAAPDAIAALAALAADPLLKSVRPMLQDLPDVEWILRPQVQATLARLPALGIRFDALVKPAQLPALLTMLERNPDLDVVIDHGAKPDIAGGAWQPWADFMRAVAASPRVYCKLSGLATEAAANWSADTLRPYVAHLCECFGPQRLMWGSDWPVVLLGGGYARWHAAAGALLAELSSDERGAVFGDNARRFYALDVESAPRPG